MDIVIILLVTVILFLLGSLHSYRKSTRSIESKLHFDIGDRVVVNTVYGAPYVKCPVSGTVVNSYSGYVYDVRLDSFKDVTFGVRAEDIRLCK